MLFLLVGLWYILITAAMCYPFGGCIINCLKYSSSASSMGKFNVAQDMPRFAPACSSVIVKDLQYIVTSGNLS